MDIEATNYLLNEGYKSRAFNLLPKPKKKRREEFKVNDFVDSRKAIEGSSSDEEDLYKKARSKAAREELESTKGGDPDINNRFKPRNKKPPLVTNTTGKRTKTKTNELKKEDFGDEILDEINEYQKKVKTSKKKKRE